MKSLTASPWLSTVLLAALAAAAPSAGGAEEKGGVTPSTPFEMTKPGLDVGVVVSDMAKAKKFYGDALGLKPLPPLPLTLNGGGEMVRFQSGPTVVKLRTFATTPPKVETGTMSANGIRLLTMRFPDADAVTKRLLDNGFANPSFGARTPAGYRVGFVPDPDGNQIELLAFAPDTPADVLDHFAIGLTVSDAQKSRDFYGKVLGLKEQEPQALANRGGLMKYTFEAGQSTIKFWAPTAERPTRTGKIGDAQGIRYITFLVKDVDATHKALLERGVKVTTPPTDLGTVARIMLVSDPDGNTVEFATPGGPRP